MVLDCADPQALAEFWAPILDGVVLGAEDPYVIVGAKDGAGTFLILQRVPEPKLTKNRVHFDVYSPDVESEAARLVGLGATRVSEGPVEEHGFKWVVLADPEGNEFCVCRGDSA